MGMNNPHNPEQALWDAYTGWAEKLKSDPHNDGVRGNAEYYYGQWEKQCEKRVKEALRDHKVKETAGDKMPKVKPKADKLKS